MESLSNIEAFVRSAEAKSFSVAARRLGLTPAAISKNIAKLEASLGVRLFQRSTRRLTLTEAGERFLADVSSGLTSIQSAIAKASQSEGQPAGTLKVSLAPAFGRDYVLPYLGAFLARYPAITPDFHFENRPVDIIGEGFDAAIGGGIELMPGVYTKELARVHIIAVAAPTYLAGRPIPKVPADLASCPGILRRSPQTGRIHTWSFRHRNTGEQATIDLKSRLIFSDPEAICRAAVLGLGIALIPVIHALEHLEAGSLVRVLPLWHADSGSVSLYFASHRKQLPAKTRAFVDFMVDCFRRDKLAERFRAD